MVGANRSISSGWDQGSEVRAWTSRTQSFSSRDQIKGSASTIAEAVARLRSIEKYFNAKFGGESSALQREPDPEAFFSGLLNMGLRLEVNGDVEAAARVYSIILEFSTVGASAYGGPLQREAEARLNGILGKGPVGLRIEGQLRQFVDHAADPAAILAMMTGGMVYKTTRLAALNRLLCSPARNFWTSGWGAKGAASILGFSAEVPAFVVTAKLGNAVLSRPQGWDVSTFSKEIASGGIVLGALKLTGFGATLASQQLHEKAASGIFRGTMQQGSMLAGIMLGHRLEEAAGLKEAAKGPAFFFENLATLLHFNVGSHFSKRVMGERLRGLEARLDYQASQLSGEGKVSGQGGSSIARAQSFAGVGKLSSAALAESKNSNFGPLIIQSSAINDGGSGSQVARLTQRFRKVFPAQGPEIYSEEIIAASLRIPCQIPQFHQRLLEALSKAPNRGKLSQLYTVLALDDVFLANALSTSTGSFDYALLQMLVGQTMADENGANRLEAAGKLLGAMERGLTRDDLSQIPVESGYGKELISSIHPKYSNEFRARHGAHAVREWSDYPDHHRIQLFNYVYQTAGEHHQRAHRMIELFGQGRRDLRYHSFDLESALDFAATHPFGKLAIQRILHVFATADIPEKITEIGAITLHPELLEHIGRLTLRNATLIQDTEALAKQITGTYHTGFFNDVRLARKVLASTYESLPYRLDPSRMARAKKALEENFERFFSLNRSLDRDSILVLLGIDPLAAQPQSMAWTKLVEVVPDAEFEQIVERWGQANDCDLSIFVRERKTGGRQRIVIRAMPAIDTSTPSGKAKAFGELINRLKGVVHEAEHWRHFNGVFEGLEEPSHPFVLSNISRSERLVSEIMAMLAESNWRLKNVDNDLAEIARRLGLNLPLYLRNVADYTYNSRENERVAAQLEKLP